MSIDDRRATPPSPSTASDLPPIDYDRDMDRTYIPLPGGWEIQTKGKGSTFRIAHIPSRTRWMVLNDELHEPLEALARDVRAALAAKPPAREAAQSIDTPEFREMLQELWMCMGSTKMNKVAAKLIAYIDTRATKEKA